MAVRIRSLVASGPVLVPLSSGTTLRLSPGQVSDDMPDVEVANNAKVGKLQRQGMIDVATVRKSEVGAELTSQPATGPAAGLAEEPAHQPQKAQGGPGGKSRAQPRK